MEKSAVIIDDEIHVRKIMNVLLSSLGVKTIGEASTGEQGLALLKDSQPDMVFLDINLPKMSGLDVLKFIKREYPDIQVVILSSVNAKSAIEEAIDNGADHYIIKDTGPDELKKILDSFLKSLA